MVFHRKSQVIRPFMKLRFFWRESPVMVMGQNDNFNFFKNGSLNTRHNYFFLRFNLSNFFWNMQFNLIKKRILSDDKRPFHIWWHPRDLVFNVNNNLTRLTYLMDFFKFLIDKKKFLSCNILNS